MAEPKYSLSPSYTPEQLEEIYRNVVLKQDFYGETYGAEASFEPNMELARVVCASLAPKKHMDVGCGRGYFVAAMRKMGVESSGLDFSAALIEQAVSAVRPHLAVSSAENWMETTPMRDVDLLSFMEVFEHLPYSVVGCLLEKLRTRFQGRLFLTVPSYGVDERFQTGIVTNEGTPEWQADMMTNRPFQNIVLANGVPHHGHISLASYRWWTEFFLLHGWMRHRDMEQQLGESASAILQKYHYNPYVLEQLNPPAKAANLMATNRLGGGWHSAESFGNRAGRWTNGNAEVFLTVGQEIPNAIHLEMAAPHVNVIRDWYVSVNLERLVYANPWHFQWMPLAVSARVPLLKRGKIACLTIEPTRLLVKPLPDLQLTDIIRLSIVSPSFSPKDYHLSGDARQLGLIVHEVRVCA
jgi:SAM-dependent methyltransferase